MSDVVFDGEFAGVAEIAQEFGVGRSVVSMWDFRRATNGFPEPVARLAAGPVYDMTAVRAWHDRTYSHEVPS